MTFEGKVILITGAASGIGAETAEQFARLNASLVLVDRAPLDLKWSVDARHASIVADLTNDDDVRNTVKRAIDRFGRIDVLVNAAGIALPGGIRSSTLEQFDRVMAVNIRSLFHLTLVAVPHLIESKGCIVNVSSCATKKVLVGWLVYSLAKTSVDHLTKSLAVELASKGVRVNAVSPGAIRTAMLINSGQNLEELAEANPMGRLGTASEVAGAILFLAGDSASYITGETLSVDGAFRLT